jgi:hypothetical protein
MVEDPQELANEMVFCKILAARLPTSQGILKTDFFPSCIEHYDSCKNT